MKKKSRAWRRASGWMQCDSNMQCSRQINRCDHVCRNRKINIAMQAGYLAGNQFIRWITMSTRHIAVMARFSCICTVSAHIAGHGHLHILCIGHMRFRREQAKTSGQNLHGKQPDHQSGEAAQMPFKIQHAANIRPDKVKKQWKFMVWHAHHEMWKYVADRWIRIKCGRGRDLFRGFVYPRCYLFPKIGHGDCNVIRQSLSKNPVQTGQACVANRTP